MKKTLLPWVFIIVVTCMSQELSAQITFPDDVDDETPAAPIDGLIAFGIIAGTVIGIRNKKHTEE